MAAGQILSEGSTGQEVFELQTLLRAAGWLQGEGTGRFDQETRSALVNFQNEIGLPADGVAGPQTMARLREFAAERSSASGASGSSAESVMQSVQTPAPDTRPRPRRKATKSRPSGSGDVGEFVRVPDLDDEERGSEPGGESSVTQTEAPEPEPARPPEPTPVAVSRPGSVAAGFVPDSPTGPDWIGITDDVNTLAAVLADRKLEDSLAVGIFGDWGSGKTFFMRQLQARIATLSDASAKAEGDSFFCPYVRQIYFNTWAHSDGDLWRSLGAAVHLGVAGMDEGAINARSTVDNLRLYQEATSQKLSDARSGQAETAQRLSDVQSRIDDLQKREQQKIEEIGPQGRALVQGVEGVSEGQKLLRSFAAVWRSMPGWQHVAAIAIVLAALAATVFLALNQALALNKAVIGAVLTAIASASAGIGFVARSLKWLNELVGNREEQSELRREKATLQEELRSREQEAADARSPFLQDYAAAQAARLTQEREMGVIAEIREAFAYLSSQIGESRLRRGRGEEDLAPIDRVIVYMDDLDRCRPGLVVDALEAIKVLMDLPHFAVVVGVDPGWLFRSLSHRFAEILGTPADASTEWGWMEWAPTPQNYLEKIFQISVSVPPMQGVGFGRLVRSLLTPTQISAHPGAIDAAGQGQHEGAADGVVVSIPVDGQVGGVDEGIDLSPSGLAIPAEEIEFMTGLFPLFQTPRAAKRLTNVYRLIRTSIPPEGLEELNAGGYVPLITMLGLSIGCPNEADDVFRLVLQNEERGRWSEFTAGLRPQRNTPGPEDAAMHADYRNAAFDRLDEAGVVTWSRIANALEAVTERTSPPDIAEFARWVPIVVRYSFYPWREISAT